jgi:hypothetical protein
MSGGGIFSRFRPFSTWFDLAKGVIRLIGRMLGINWPTGFGVDCGVEAARLDALLHAIVAIEAERLESTQLECVGVSTMRLDVIGGSGRPQLTDRGAHAAQRLGT